MCLIKQIFRLHDTHIFNFVMKCWLKLASYLKETMCSFRSAYGVNSSVQITHYIQDAHYNGCLRRATECIFCSSMSLKIREYIFIVKQPKETHNIPGHLWQKNGVDIFKSDSIEWLVDYFSNLRTMTPQLSCANWSHALQVMGFLTRAPVYVLII